MTNENEFLNVLKKIVSKEKIHRRESSVYISLVDSGLCTGLWTTDGASNAKLTPAGLKYIQDNEPKLVSLGDKFKEWMLSHKIISVAIVVFPVLIWIVEKYFSLSSLWMSISE